MKPTWQALGFDLEGEVIRTLAAQDVGIVAVVLKAIIAEGLTGERVYFKPFEAAQYKRLVPSGPTESQRDPVMTSTGHIFFSTVVYSRRADGGWGAPGGTLCRFDTGSLMRSVILGSEDIVLEAPYQRAFIKGLIDVSADEKEATVTLGLQRPEGEGSVVDYGIFVLNLQTRTPRHLMALSRVVV